MSTIKKIPKQYVKINCSIYSLVIELKNNHEAGILLTDNYYSHEFLKLWREARDLKIQGYEYEKWATLHRDIAYCISIELFPLFESYEIEIPDPTGKMRAKYKWITSEDELYSEVMKFYPKFKKLIEEMKSGNL